MDRTKHNGAISIGLSLPVNDNERVDFHLDNVIDQLQYNTGTTLVLLSWGPIDLPDIFEVKRFGTFSTTFAVYAIIKY